MTKALHTTPKQNRILAMLPLSEYLRLEPELEFVLLTQGQVLQETGSTVDFLYFPTSSIVSLARETDDGATLQLAMTGRDGLVGVSMVLGNETSGNRMVVQTAGEAYRLPSQVAQWLFDQDGQLPKLSARYAEYLMSQLAQIALCNHHHSVEQQLCRWMLLCLDLLQGTQLEATQEMMASMIGTRRVAVSDAASNLLAAGLIAYSRGQITVVDRPGLESRACGCYAALQRESAHLLPAANVENKRWALPKHQSFRMRAESRLKQNKLNAPLSPIDLGRLLHELQVHQIELEMQNEELASLYADVYAVRDRYADIYDFAPVSYVTLDALGVIRQINLAGAILLGIKRSQITQHRFGASMSAPFLPAFNQFLKEVLESRTRLNCEIELSATPHRNVSIVHIEAIADESGQECRMVINDITEQRRLELALREQQSLQ